MQLTIPVYGFAPQTFGDDRIIQFGQTCVENEVSLDFTFPTITPDNMRYCAVLNYKDMTIMYKVVDNAICTYNVLGNKERLYEFGKLPQPSAILPQQLPIMLQYRTLAMILEKHAFYKVIGDSVLVCDFLENDIGGDVKILNVSYYTPTRKWSTLYKECEGWYNAILFDPDIPVDFNGFTHDMFMANMESDGWASLFHIDDHCLYIESELV